MQDIATTQDRLGRLQAEMKGADIRLAILGPFATSHYLFGSSLPDTARFNCVLVPDSGTPTFFVPRIQLSLVPAGFATAVWEEDQDPFALLASLAGPALVGIDNRIRSGFLLRIQQALAGATFQDLAQLTTSLRLLKDGNALSILGEAGRRFDAIWDEFFATGKLIGRTENDVRRQIGRLILGHGFDSIAWIDVGSGPNGASPLHVGSERIIEAGDPVVIDFAATLDGYHMDTCRTPVAGSASEHFVKILDIANRAYDAAEAAARPGIKASRLDAVARDIISEHGFGENFLHRLGHGLGLEPHEPPFIVSGNDLVLQPGMVFSNEPGIYLAEQYGVRVENILALTEDGFLRFGNATRKLVEMD